MKFLVENRLSSDAKIHVVLKGLICLIKFIVFIISRPIFGLF